MPDEAERKTTAAGDAAGSGGRGVPRVPDHELICCVGRGSFGEVWLARNVMGAWRAVKVVHRSSFESERPYEREFHGIRKFEPVSRTHDSQMDILQVGRNDAEGYFYYVMELADDAGGPLTPFLSPSEGERVPAGRERGDSDSLSHPMGEGRGEGKSLLTSAATYVPRTLKRELQQRGRLPVAECMEIGLALATALDHLHKNGLVHRDVKPSNIIFVGSVPKLADIGLVTAVDATMSCPGTEGYIPPEGHGRPPADLYSLGKVLYEMSSGKDRQDFPDPPTNLGAFADREELLELDEVIQRACAHDANKRYQSAEELHADLLLLKTGRSVRRTHRLERRLALTTRIGVAALLLTLLAGGAWLHERNLRGAIARAETAAKVNLRQAYLDQAHANRWSGRVGRRFGSLDVLAKAVDLTLELKLPPEKLLELRNEAIACMILPDLRMGEPWPTRPQDGGSVSFDAQFERYARNDTNGNISVRRFQNHAQIAVLPRPGTNNELLRLSPDGRFVAAVYFPLDGYYAGRSFHLWDVDRQQVVLNLTNGIHHHCVDFSHDGQWLALVQQGGSLATYDLATLHEQPRFPVSGEPYWMRLSPDGRLVAWSDWKAAGRVEVRELASGRIQAVLPHRGLVRCLDWQPEGRLLATACDDHHLYLWDVAHTQQVAVLKGHTAQPIRLGFNRAGDKLASVGWDSRLKLWDVPSGQELLSRQPGTYHLQFSPEDRWLGPAAAGDDPRVPALLEVADGRECRTLGSHTNGSPSAASFSADGRLLATIGDKAVHLWDVTRGRPIASFPFQQGRGVVLHPDGRSLFASGGGGLQRWPIQREDGPGGIKVKFGPPETLSRLPKLNRSSLSPEGRRLAVGQEGSGALVFDLSQPATNVMELIHTNATYVSLSPDGPWIVTSTWHGQGVKVWAAPTGLLLTNLTDEVETIAQFSPDRRWLLTSTGREYRLWETGSWQPRHVVPRQGASKAGTLAAFGPNGTVLALAHRLLGVRLVETATGRELATLNGDEQYPLCFSPDGNLLVTGDTTGAVCLWDLPLIRRQLAALKLDWTLAALAWRLSE